MKKDGLGDRLHREKALSLVSQYENMLKNNENHFFGPDSFEHIIEYYEEHLELDKALGVVEYALMQYPYSAVFLIRKAGLVFEAGLSQKALNLLEKAQILAPSEQEIFTLKAEIFTKLERYDEALDILQYALIFADKEERGEIYVTISDVYDSEGKELDAFNYIRKALKLNPENEAALNKVDYYVESLENYEDSIELHQWIINESPYCYLAWYNLGNAYFGLSLFEKAIEAYGFVTVINDKFDLAFRDCGEAYYELGKYMEAKEQYTEALNLGESDEDLLYNIGLCYYQMEQFNNATVYFKEALQLNEMHQDSHYQLGEYYAKIELWQSALHHYEKSLDISPDDLMCLAAISEVYILLGYNEKAVQVNREALERNFNKKEYWLLMAKIHFTLQEYDKAEEVSLMATEELEDSELDIINYFLAAALMAQGKKAEATVHFSQALLQNYNEHEHFFDLVPQHKTNMQLMALLEQYAKD